MKRMISLVLAFVMCLSLLGGVVTAAPAGTIDKVVIKGFEAPAAGVRVKNMSSESLGVPQGAGYYLPQQEAYWKNGKDQNIYTGYYAFEDGGTYKLSLSIGAADYAKVFSNKTEVVLEGVPAGSYSVEVEPMVANSYLMATFTFVLPGNFEPDPISAVHLLGSELRDGVRIDANPIMLYNHGYVGPASWSGELTSRGEFIGGNTYDLVFRVYDYSDVGYAPLKDITVTYNGQKLDADLELFDKGEVLHVSAKITVPEIKTVSSVVTYGFASRYPVEGGNAKSYVPREDLTWPDSKGYYIQEVSPWFQATNNLQLSEEAQFVRGEKYYLNVTYRLEDTFNSKFSDAPTFTLHGVPEEYYDVSVSQRTYATITVRYTFTAQKAPAEKISRVNVFDVDTPRPNVKADYSALVYDGGYRVKEVKWYNNTGKHYLYIPNHDQYQGNEYYVEVYLEALDGYEFANALDLGGYINGEKASVVARLSDTECKVEYHFGSCQMGQIDTVKVWGLTPPETGAEGDYYAESGDHYYLNKDDAYFDNGIGWWDITDSCYLEPGDTFLPGHQYQVELYLTPTVGYQFAMNAATVDGQTATSVYPATNQVIIYHEYPACKVDGKQAVSQVELLNVNVPLAGGTPGYSAGISAEGYRLENKTEGNYIQGICWFDKTMGQEMKSSEAFQAGHEYQILCSLKAQDGYTFIPETAATVNGGKADLINNYGDGCTLVYSFGVCKGVGKEIASVDFVSLDAPAAGKLPDYFVTAKAEGYSNKSWNDQHMNNGIVWYDITAKCNITPDTKFRAGHQYQVYILSVTEPGYYFADSVTGTINGNPVEIFDKNGEKNLCYTFPQIPSLSNPFTDLKKDAYYYDAVLWAVNEGITNGTTATTFSPNEVCTRGQVVTFLWRAAGSPEPKATSTPFTDLKKNAYYYKAVLWAVEKGITNGTSATTFSPDEDCTRGQIVTFLWRSQGSPVSNTTCPFTDVKTSSYYYDAVLWAVEKKITNGTSATTFSPDAECTRGQIVTFLYRCLG